ncbi:TonB-dependent receptor [Salinisphaera sp. Q1T1-3]|uniref:TonB-dependent receptor n=1 Tax=Salinisphaera sp. Q1T1-3 TaxID=2321229 RepID=UPI0013143EBC|nr:TonB-dependent receptor [Salinisphaera sp. Q1T1-3]
MRRFSLWLSASVAGILINPAMATAQSAAVPVAPADPDTPVTKLSPISVQALAFPVPPEQAIAPVAVVDGTALIRRRSETLGETLSGVPGISTADFGAGVGRPVIRGLSGARVRVQENGLSSADVSTLSQDHAVTIDPYSAKRIEVLKGPSTLLYGSGAIGGVVNVVSDRIPDAVPDAGISGSAALERGDSTLGTRLEHLDVTAGHGPMAVNLQGLRRLTDDYRANDNRPIDNSATDTTNYSGGASYVGDWGYVGGAAGHFGRTYGVPGEESHIHMTENRYDLRGEFNDLVPGFSTIEFAGAYTDYRHTEGEAVPDEIFDNNETEFRLAGTHVPWHGFTGTVGLQGFTRDYQAFGEARTFVPPTTTDSIAAFWVEERPIGERWTVQGGARVEYNRQNTSQGRTDTDAVPYSLSLGAKRTIGQAYVVTASLGHYERAPSTEELYSFGPHEATLTYERGNPDFSTEKSENVELGFRKINGRARFDTSLYYTHFHDFIYLASVDRGLNADGTGASSRDGRPDYVDDEGMFDPTGEFQLVDFAGGNANFYGGEAKVSYDLLTGVRRLTASLQGDYVRAELESGENLPRITPGRYGAALDYEDTRWTGHFSVLQNSATDHAAPLEAVSASFTEMDAFVGFKIPSFDKTKALVYVRGDNLLDERIVRQTSFLRVPLAGRALSTGINVTF